jgi:hypothetical protein
MFGHVAGDFLAVANCLRPWPFGLWMAFLQEERLSKVIAHSRKSGEVTSARVARKVSGRRLPLFDVALGRLYRRHPGPVVKAAGAPLDVLRGDGVAKSRTRCEVALACSQIWNIFAEVNVSGLPTAVAARFSYMQSGCAVQRG